MPYDPGRSPHTAATAEEVLSTALAKLTDTSIPQRNSDNAYSIPFSVTAFSAERYVEVILDEYNLGGFIHYNHNSLGCLAKRSRNVSALAPAGTDDQDVDQSNDQLRHREMPGQFENFEWMKASVVMKVKYFAQRLRGTGPTASVTNRPAYNSFPALSSFSCFQFHLGDPDQESVNVTIVRIHP
jgi:hypothetical protein